MHDHFIFENSFGARYLSTTKEENPTPHISRYDDHSSEQNVVLSIDLIVLLNQHGDAFKQQADAKEDNTHQAAIFASSTQGLSVLREHEQQDWQAAPESDERYRFHRKQDAKDITQLVDGDDTVFIRLVESMWTMTLWTAN